MGVWVDTRSDDGVAVALHFLCQTHFFQKLCFFEKWSEIGPIIRIMGKQMASWTLSNFDWYPKCPKWSSQSRPVAKFGQIWVLSNIHISESASNWHRYKLRMCRDIAMNPFEGLR